MRAIVYEKYGPPEVLHFKDVPTPAPSDDEVQIKIHATTVHVGDTRIRGFRVPLVYWIPMRLFLGLTKPKRKILGMECAGEIESVGKYVRRFKEGDKVMALTGFECGAYAQYRCLASEGGDERKGMVVNKPSNTTYGEAAAACAGALTALSHMRKVNVQKGQKVLIYGASGSVGTFAVQLAKFFGAEVTGVCSTSNLDMVRSIGADSVIDYTKEDLFKTGETYDVVFDAVYKTSRSRCRNILKENGVFDSSHSNVPTQQMEDLLFIKDLIEKGNLKSVVDRTYRWEQIVEAHRYVDNGHKKGNVVLTVEHNEKT